jgi:hypothetical protein
MNGFGTTRHSNLSLHPMDNGATRRMVGLHPKGANFLHPERCKSLAFRVSAPFGVCTPRVRFWGATGCRGAWGAHPKAAHPGRGAGARVPGARTFWVQLHPAPTRTSHLRGCRVQRTKKVRSRRVQHPKGAAPCTLAGAPPPRTLAGAAPRSGAGCAPCTLALPCLRASGSSSRRGRRRAIWARGIHKMKRRRGQNLRGRCAELQTDWHFWWAGTRQAWHAHGWGYGDA